MRRSTRGGLFAGLLAALLLVTGCGGVGSNSPQTSDTLSMQLAGSPTKPLNAEQAYRMSPPVRGGDAVRSWAELDQRYGKDTSYVDCVERRLDFDWDTKVPWIVGLEKKRPKNGLTVIVALNVNQSPKWVRDFARDNEGGVTDNTPVLYTSRIDNTMTNGCAPFVDSKRSTVTVVDVVPTGTKENGSPWLDTTKPIKGFMNRCKNPVIIQPDSLKPPPTSGSPSPSASTSPSPSGSTSSTPPGTTPPATPTPSGSGKVPSEDPAQNGNSGNGGGKNEDPGPGEYKPPSEVNHPPDKPREDPDPPKPNAPAPPTVTSTPRPSGSPTPTVDPGGQDNDGVIDEDDCAIC